MSVKRNSLLTEFFLSIANRGRVLLGLDSSTTAVSVEELLRQCQALVSWQGEATGLAIAHTIFAGYAQLDRSERIAFLCLLDETFGTDLVRFKAALAEWERDPSPENATHIHFASEPQRQELLRRLNRVPDGTARLVDMRALLLEAMRVQKGLRSTDRDFLHLFSSWFNRGFLELRHIDWSTPAAILDKIIEYEAVHEIQDWQDLRRRIDPPDRRCYAFFHPSLEDEPLIFVEIALVQKLPPTIGAILAEGREGVELEQANTAVFYSISNCQAGLRGVSFGNFLIKQVVNEIVRDLPHVTNFVTLSPMPGFVRWVEEVRDAESAWLEREGLGEVVSLLAEEGWVGDEGKEGVIRPGLMSLGAYYLMRVKDKRNKPLDPVARFHLGNGARLDGLNWLANGSEQGVGASYGLMANYRYVLKYIEGNHEAFADTGAVMASAHVQKLQKQMGDL